MEASNQKYLVRLGGEVNTAAPAAWEPNEAKAPPALWQTRARAFLERAINYLWSTRGESMRQWLHDAKGLSDASIRDACLGLTSSDLFDQRRSWGLEPAFKEDVRERMQWLPAGLVIPLIISGAVHRLRIRRSEPVDGARYVITSGSDMRPMILGSIKHSVVIVESELDALLLNQEAGDLVGVVAMGSAQSKPDIKAHELLQAAGVILVALDADAAGAQASRQFWLTTYTGKAKRWPTIRGKDPAEAQLNGLDLRAWIQAGLC